MVKKVLIGLPPALLAQIDFVASAEHRTRSDLIREALRRYVASFRLPEVASCVQPSTETSSESQRLSLESAYTLPSKASA